MEIDTGKTPIPGATPVKGPSKIGAFFGAHKMVVLLGGGVVATVGVILYVRNKSTAATAAQQGSTATGASSLITASTDTASTSTTAASASTTGGSASYSGAPIYQEYDTNYIGPTINNDQNNSVTNTVNNTTNPVKVETGPAGPAGPAGPPGGTIWMQPLPKPPVGPAPTPVVVPKTVTPVASTAPVRDTYKVQAGDTWYSIIKKYFGDTTGGAQNVSSAEALFNINAYNKGNANTNSALPKVGSTLLIPTVLYGQKLVTNSGLTAPPVTAAKPK